MHWLERIRDVPVNLWYEDWDEIFLFIVALFLFLRTKFFHFLFSFVFPISLSLFFSLFLCFSLSLLLEENFSEKRKTPPVKHSESHFIYMFTNLIFAINCKWLYFIILFIANCSNPLASWSCKMMLSCWISIAVQCQRLLVVEL